MTKKFDGPADSKDVKEVAPRNMTISERMSSMVEADASAKRMVDASRVASASEIETFVEEFEGYTKSHRRESRLLPPVIVQGPDGPFNLRTCAYE